MWAMILHLCEGKPSLIVDFEDLLDGVDIGGCPKVQTQVVLACCTHDLLKRQKRAHYLTFIGPDTVEDHRRSFLCVLIKHLAPVVVVSQNGVSDLWTIDNNNFQFSSKDYSFPHI